MFCQVGCHVDHAAQFHGRGKAGVILKTFLCPAFVDLQNERKRVGASVGQDCGRVQGPRQLASGVKHEFMDIEVERPVVITVQVKHDVRLARERKTR